MSVEANPSSEAKQIKQLHSAIREVAHELRAPLAGIKMGCDQLARNPSHSELVLTMAQGFPKQVDKIFQLTSALLKYSKELSQGIKLDWQQVDLVPFLKEGVKEFKAKVEFPHLTIDFNSENPSLLILMDRTQMTWALNALLTNAAEACSGSQGAEIRVQLQSPTPAWVEVSVSDNGPGISTEMQERLFEPFVSPEKKNGLSLGLSLSQRIIEAHGGTLQFQVTPQGASFCIRLPIKGPVEISSGIR